MAIDISLLNDKQILELRSAVEREARKRKLTFETGPLGEKIAIELFKNRPDLPVLTLAAAGTKNVDALSRDGDRYSIKTIHRGRKTGTIYPDTENKDRQLFEYLVVIVLDEDYSLKRAILMSWAQFCVSRSWDRRMNAWYVGKSEKALSLGQQIFPSIPDYRISSKLSK